MANDRRMIKAKSAALKAVLGSAPISMLKIPRVVSKNLLPAYLSGGGNEDNDVYAAW